MTVSGCRQAERRVLAKVVPVPGNAFILLAPGMCILRDEGAFENRLRCCIRAPLPAIENLAQGIHARCRDVIQEIPAPVAVVGSCAFLVGRDRNRSKNAARVVIAFVGVKVAVVLDARRVKEIEGTVAVEVRIVVVRFVIQFMVTRHRHQDQRRLTRRQVKRRLGKVERVCRQDCDRPADNCRSE